MSTTPKRLNVRQIVSSYSHGTWTSTAGSSDANIISVLKDTNNNTYVNLTGFSFARMMKVDNPNLPAGARVKTLRQRANIKTSVKPGSYYLSYIWIPSNSNYSKPLQQADSRSATYVGYSAFTTYNSPSINSFYDGSVLTSAQLNNLHIYWASVDQQGRPYMQNTNMRVSELWLEMYYDERPVTSDVFPTSVGNTVVGDTNTPLITWSYSDDWENQNGYEVRIYNSVTNALVYTSGIVDSNDYEHQVTNSLASGATYKVQVRTRQVWNGAGDDFWSNWAYSAGTFSINVVGAPQATAIFTPSDTNAYIEVDAVPFANMLTYDEAAFENGFLSWGQTTSSTGGTFARNTNSTYVLEGTESMKVTQSAANTIVLTRSFTKVTAGIRYVFGVQYKVDAATTVGTLSLVAGVNWLDKDGNFLGYNEGSAVPGSTSSWSRVSVLGTAPANTQYAQWYFYTNSTGANGKIFYVDAATVYVSASDSSFYLSPSRGGYLGYYLSNNYLGRGESTFDNTVTLWDTGNANTTVDISSTQSRQGTQSLRLTRTSTTGQALSTLPTPPFLTLGAGYVSLFASFYPASGVNLVAFGINWYDDSATLITNTEISYNSGSITTGAWNDKQAAVALPTQTSITYGIPYVYFNNVSASGICYVDALTISVLGFDSNGVAITTPVGYQPGAISDSIPRFVIEGLDIDNFPKYTQAQFDALTNPTKANLVTQISNRYISASHGEAEWQTLYEDDLLPDVGVYPFKDRSAQSAVARMYRVYSYKYENSALITSKPSVLIYDGYLCPQMINFTSTWISTVDREPDYLNGGLVVDGFRQHEFIAVQEGHTQTYGKDAGQFIAAGREFPIVNFSAQSSKSITVTIVLDPTNVHAEKAALKKLSEARSLVVYRNGRRRQRLKGLMGEINYSFPQGKVVVSFTITAAGQQFE